MLASKNLSAPKAQSLRAELTKCIRKAKRPASNISKGEFKALQELKADIDITILPADKGRSTVILNTKEYESKLSNLLSDSKTYEMIQKNPTPKFKRTDRNDSTMSKGGPNPYSSQTCYLFQKKSPRCMAYLGSTGRMFLYEQLSQAEEASQCVGIYFCHMVGKSEHHTQNSGDFVDKVKNLEVPPGQKLIAYDVSALFTSIPLPDAIKAVRIKSHPSVTGEDHWTTEFMPEHHLFHIQGSDIQPETRSSHGITSVAHNSKPIYIYIYIYIYMCIYIYIMEGFEEIAIRTAPTPPITVFQARGRYIYRDPRIPCR